jgi:hypothetical protein
MPEKPENEIEFVELPFPNLYSNAMKISSSPFDISVLIMERIEPKTATVKARVVMSPLHAKMLLEALAEHLGKWEETHGEIGMPPLREVTPSPTEPEPQP